MPDQGPDQGSTRVVLIALTANAAIAVSKFVAAAVSGSSAMFAEGVHSVADTGNQLLLLFGMRRAGRPPDARHPFGYGQELYFWSFVVAALLFTLGAGVSGYEAWYAFAHPGELESAWLAILVLLVAAVFEGRSWRAAWMESRRDRKDGESLVQFVRRTKNAALIVVLFEDSAALVGIAVAALGVILSHLFGTHVFDGVASAIIALLLAASAVALASQTRRLLIGQAAEPEMLEHIRNLLQTERTVDRVNEVATMHFGPDRVLVALSVEFCDGLSLHDVEEAIHRLESDIRGEYPAATRIFIESQSMRSYRETHTDRPTNGPAEG